VLTIFGEKDGSQMQKLLTRLPEQRKEGARWSIAVQWDRRHEFVQANNLSFIFLNEVIGKRLPKEPDAAKPPALKGIPLEEGWLGDLSTWSKDGKRAVIQPWNDFKGARDQACWFPSQRVAAAWQAFVSASKEITISEPPGLGDGQPFVLHPAGKPISVKLKITAKRKPLKVELWDGQQRLAQRTEAPWNFELSLKPGVHALYAVMHEENQPVLSSRLHTIVVSE
jgi:hypothetical protein